MDLAQANLPPANSSQDEQVLLSKIKDISSTQAVGNEELERQPGQQNNIYRGEPPPFRSRSFSPAVSSSSSATSSSGWSALGLRRGALGAILERAINRWARTGSDTSTTSSTSSSSSNHNRTPQRWKRRSSVATSQNTHTENIIRARRRAWEQGRGLPREFVLFLPAALVPPAVDNRLDHTRQDRRVFCSTSLPLVLSQLESVIKHSTKLRKHKQHPNPSTGNDLGQQDNDVAPSVPASRSLHGEMPGNSKGKNREDLRTHKPNHKAATEKSSRRPAWWLDVSSPTWNDMREIGKLLHLHPLTLEDILHQEPREKLEVFPRLGYYFIVFHALDSELTRAKAKTQLDLTMKGDKTVLPFTDDMIGATNVYIVVFKEGICTFHFEDISDHTLRVRNRIVKLEETFHMSSDWIAHGILDSIVDQFFPWLNSIEREVKDLDDLALSINVPPRNRRELQKRALPSKSITKPVGKGGEQVSIVEVDEKNQTGSSTFHDKIPKWSLRCVRPFAWVTYVIPRLVSTSAVSKLKQWTKPWRRKETASPSPLIRMASTRKLVTSLTRLLGTKSEVVSQIRKRLAGSGFMGSYVIPSEQLLAGEVGIYLGDIQDHILALQQSLAHYERMLSHSHPAYLSYLRVSFAQATASMDNKLFYLSLLSVTIISMQVPVGLLSMNVRIPRNLRITPPPNHHSPFNTFGIMLVIEILVALTVVSLTRYWWRRAERKFARARQSKL